MDPKLTTYRPLGKRILLHVLPKDTRAILIPDSAQSPEASRLKVMAIGPEVDLKLYPVAVGDIVQLVQQPVSMAGVDPVQQLLTVLEYEVNVIVQKEAADE